MQVRVCEEKRVDDQLGGQNVGLQDRILTREEGDPEVYQVSGVWIMCGVLKVGNQENRGRNDYHKSLLCTSEIPQEYQEDGRWDDKILDPGLVREEMVEGGR